MNRKRTLTLIGVGLVVLLLAGALAVQQGWIAAPKPAAATPNPSDDFLALALDKAAQGDAEGALQALDVAIAADPQGAADAYYYRGLIRAELGDLAAAIEDFSQAIAINAHRPEFYGARATTYMAQGRTATAIEDFDKAIELAPDHAPTYVNRGQAYVEVGIYDLALADLNKALELDPNLLAAYFNRGVLYLQTERPELALKDFSTAIDLNPNVPAPYFNRAVTYIQLGDNEKAAADLGIYLTLTKEDADGETRHQAEMLLESLVNQ